MGMAAAVQRVSACFRRSKEREEAQQKAWKGAAEDMKGVTTAPASRKEDIVKYVPTDVKGVTGAYSAR